MKTLLFLSGLLFLTSLSALAAEKYTITLDWNDTSTLKDNVVQLCDDTNFEVVEVIIPGKPRKDFYVETAADISTGKPLLGCTVSVKEGATSTKYSFDAENGSCIINVYKVNPDWRAPEQKAIYEIHDAC